MLENMTMEQIDALTSKLKVQTGVAPSEKPFDAMSMAESGKMAARRTEKVMSKRKLNTQIN